MASTTRTNSGDWLMVLAAVVILVCGSAYDFYVFASQARVSSSSTTTSVVSGVATHTVEAQIINGSQSGGNPYGPCVIAGQPGGFNLAILSDSSSAPVTGADVTAFHLQASDVCNGVLYPGNITVAHFQTDSSRWYWLDDSNAGVYNFTVSYGGHLFGFASPQMKPMLRLCLILYLPSGRTNSTYVAGGTSCG